MIIFRYLAREVLITMSAVTGVLLLIIMSGRFIKYLSKAAAGDLSANVLFLIISYRIPGFLELILPLGLFLGILLAYGRLYLESEITVLAACGVTPQRLLAMTLGPAALVALMVAALSLWVTPWGALKVEQIFTEQESMTEFDAIVPRQFHQFGSGKRVTYAEDLDQEAGRLQGVFIAEQIQRDQQSQTAVLVAESGRQYIDPDTGSRFLLLERGYRYEGVPGQADFRRTQFEGYGVKMADSPARQVVSEIETLSTAALVADRSLQAQAQLHWRLSLPVLCLVVTLLAVPLSKVNPRQGRYGRLLPSILIYLAYLSVLTAIRSSLEKGDLQQVAAIWVVHGVMLGIALSLALMPHFWSRLGERLGHGLLSLQFWRRR